MALPSVLAGPIVRRVEPRLCAFWIALPAASSSVTATIWRGIHMAGPAGGSTAAPATEVGKATTKTRPFGQRLHVALVVVKIEAPALPLTPGEIYSYDITVDGKGLKQLGLLKNETDADVPPDQRGHRPLGLALGYVTDRLPSFVTPPAVIEGTRLVHCSCRKTIGPGYDALAWLDDTIEQQHATPGERPQQLFMTGDQIYADDLSGPLLHMLSRLSHEIVGANEQLRVVAPRPSGGQLDRTLDVDLKSFPAYRRHKLVVNAGGYTSGDGENHLLGYGEYCAMYLAVWSPRVWSVLGTADQLFVAPTPPTTDLLPFFDEPEKRFGGKVDKWLAAAKKPESGFNTQLKQLALFRSTVPRVARVLANVATYMIFDDHDVTDDWNLSKKWTNRVYSKPFGQQIVRNAVMSYAVFQGWGNDPVAFEKDKNKEVLDEIEKLFAGNGPYPAAGVPTTRIDTLVGITGAAFGEQAKWSYIVPAPKMQVVVLDTRTRRKFTGQGYAPPDLVGLDRDAQLPAGPLADGRELVFIVSAAPVLGLDLIDTLAWPLAQVAIDAVHLGKGLDGSGTQKANVGTEKYDAEGWSANEVAREALLKRVATYQSAVFLSGDVHFSSSLTLDYYKKGTATPSRIVQLTASPARNEFKALLRVLIRQNPFLQSLQTAFRVGRFGWNGPSTLVLPSGATVSPGRRSRIQRSPSLLPSNGWPANTQLPADAQKGPDWRWRLQLVRDVRPETQLPTVLRQPLFPLADELDAGNALRTYQKVAARQQTLVTSRYDYVRQTVFKSAIGLVSVAKVPDGTSGTKLMLKHTLLSENGPDAVTPVAGTVHEISLAPSTEAPPAVEFR